MSNKQVIVMRQFPSLRTGKYIAQGAHAAMGAILSLGEFDSNEENYVIRIPNPFVREWLKNRFTKIAVSVKTEQELIDLHEQALAVGLPTALIRDAGLTEFGGVPTLTALGIGPGDADLINTITGKLPLF